MRERMKRKWLKGERGALYFEDWSQVKGRRVRVYKSTLEARSRRAKSRRGK